MFGRAGVCVERGAKELFRIREGGKDSTFGGSLGQCGHNWD